MKAKVFSLVVVFMTTAHFSTAKSGLDLTNLSISDDYFSKYMQQSVKRDLEKVNLLDRLISTPPRHNSQPTSEMFASRTGSKKLRQKKADIKSRKLDDIESTFDSLYSPDYNNGIDNPLMSMGSDSTSCKIISKY